MPIRGSSFGPCLAWDPRPRPRRGSRRRQPARSTDVAARPPLLTRRGADILIRLEQIMDDATRALAARDAPGRRADADDAAGPQLHQGTVAAASDQQPRNAIRGN